MVLLAAALGFGLRLAFALERIGQPPPRRGGWRARASIEYPLSTTAWLHDEQLYYLSAAVNCFRGRGLVPDYNTIGDGVFVPPPLQSLLILAVFCAAGRLVEPFTLLTLQSLGAALMVLVVAELCRRLGSWPAAALGALLVGVHPDFVFWNAYLLTDANYLIGLALLLLLLVVWAEKPRLAVALLAGLVLGLLNLQRPNALSLPPVLALAALGLHGLRRGAASAAALLLVPAAVLLPWRARNQALYAEPIIVSSNSGVYLHQANNPRLDAWTMPYIDQANFHNRGLEPRIEKSLRAPDGRLRVSYYQYSRVYARALSDYVRREPLRFLRNYLIKICNLFLYVPTNARMAVPVGLSERAYELLQRLLVIAGLAGLVALLALRPGRAAFACALVFAYFVAIGGLGGLDREGRYALPLRLFLSLFFAAGIGAVSTRRHGSEPDVATLAEREAASSSEAEQSDGVSAASS